jgi:hypothetical protein
MSLVDRFSGETTRATSTHLFRSENMHRSGLIEKSIDIFAKETHFEAHSISYIWKLVNCKIPRYFTKHIEDINAIFGQQQIENIHYTLSLIDKQPKQDRLDILVKQNITKCTNWCIEHSILYNNLVTTNIFEMRDKPPVISGEDKRRGGIRSFSSEGSLSNLNLNNKNETIHKRIG